MHTSALVRAAIITLVTGAIGVGAARSQTVVPKKENKPSQPSKTGAKPSAAPTGGAPAGQPASTPPTGAPFEPGPYITRSTPKDWNLDIRLRVMSSRPDRFDNNGLPYSKPFSFNETALLFPEVLSTGSSELNDRAITGDLSIDGRVVFEIEPGQKIIFGGVYHSGTQLIKLAFKAPGSEQVEARQVGMQLRFPVTCYKTKLDEAAAMTVAWPKGEWPAIAKSTFQPQMFVDMDGQGAYDPADVQAAVKRWLNAAGVQDPKAVPPVRLAKIITGGVVSDIQTSGDGQSAARTGEFEGFIVDSPARILAAKRGNQIEVVTLLVAAMRQAGLPARLVIGQEGTEGGENDKNFLNRGSGGKQLHAWAEFCLFDEPKNTVNWVPVDVLRLRKSSSRPPPLNNTWRYFGTHDDLNVIIPFSFTLHPPIPAVQSYDVPAFYGWVMSPANSQTGYQMLNFSPSRASKTSAPKKTDSGASPQRNR